MVKDPSDNPESAKQSQDAPGIHDQRHWMEIVDNLVVTDTMQTKPQFCGHADSEDMLEDQLWQYADGLMEAESQAAFWEKIKDCIFCLSILKRMLQAKQQSEAVPGWPLARVSLGKSRWKRQGHRWRV